jgi:hypothetical protein
MNGCIFFPAAELIRMIEPPRFRHPVVDCLAQTLEIASVDDRREDAAARRLHQPRGFGEILGSRRVVAHTGRQLSRDVHGDDVGALVGHPDGMGAALAARRSGDERDLALEPPGHLRAAFCAALTRFDPMISRWISLVPSYKRSSRTSR